MTRATLLLGEADTPDRLAIARELLAEYAALPHAVGRWPAEAAAADIAALPGPFAAPVGTLLVAWFEGAPVGCGGLQPLEAPRVAELKRVYVRPAARGQGVGETITSALIDFARNAGYGVVRLDTAPELLAAQALYTRLGFVRIPQYRTGLYDDALCFELALHSG